MWNFKNNIGENKPNLSCDSVKGMYGDSLLVAKTSVTIKKLKSKKKYYFRVKAYKKYGSRKVLSKKWSNVKRVKIK